MPRSVDASVSPRDQSGEPSGAAIAGGAEPAGWEVPEHLEDGIYILDLDWCFTYVNPVAAQRWELPREELLGRRVWDVFPGVLGSASHAAHLQAARERRTITLSAQSIWLGIWLDWTISPYPGGLLVTFRDVEAHHQADLERDASLFRERGARERLARLQAVTAALCVAATAEQVAQVILGEGLAALDAFAGLVSVQDGAALTLLHAVGYAPEFITRWRRIPLDLPVPMTESVQTGQPVWIESRADLNARYPLLAEPDAVIPSEAANALPLVVGERVLGVLGFSFQTPRDWTKDDQDFAIVLAEQCAQALERARLADAEREARDRAEAAVRLRDATLATIAHDMRAPLGVIRAQAQFLQRLAAREEVLPSSRLLDHLATINAAALRAAFQTEEIVDLARLEAGAELALSRRELDLVVLARRVADENQALARDRRIVVEARTPALVGTWDERRLERVLGNLIGNAIKFSHPGQEVTIALARVEDPMGSWAVATVRDHGIGIPEGDRARIFDRFSRGGNVGGIAGSGLGLASVQGIVEAHGGSIEVESTEGEGSTFTVRLPLENSTVSTPKNH